MVSHIPSHPNHAWLAAILPKNARTFRVQDPELAAALAEAGGILVDEAADVEIATADKLRGDGSRGVVAIERMARDDVSAVGRVAARLAGPVALRRDVKAASAALRRHGYSRIEVATWDFGRALRKGAEDQPPTLAERLPRHAVVVGDRPGSQPAETLLDAVTEQAAKSRGARLERAQPSARAGVLVTLTHDVVLRVAVGPARAQITSQVQALEHLRGCAGPTLDDSLIPWTIDQGRLGLADWSLEQKLHGTTPGWELDSRLIAPALDFLAALHSCTSPSTSRHSPADDAEVAASFLEEPHASALRGIGHSVAEAVADLPHGFAHGDFFTRNILVDDGKIVGVVDWDSAGPNRPPLLDFLHLWHMGRHKIGDLEWGPSIVSDLLPWARAGGDEVLRSLAHRIGVDVSPSKLEALVIGYWLSRIAYQLTRYADRTERRVWMTQNVDLVLQKLRFASRQ